MAIDIPIFAFSRTGGAEKKPLPPFLAKGGGGFSQRLYQEALTVAKRPDQADGKAHPAGQPGHRA
jgi:hypothetical protein